VSVISGVRTRRRKILKQKPIYQIMKCQQRNFKKKVLTPYNANIVIPR